MYIETLNDSLVSKLSGVCDILDSESPESVNCFYWLLIYLLTLVFPSVENRIQILREKSESIVITRK